MVAKTETVQKKIGLRPLFDNGSAADRLALRVAADEVRRGMSHNSAAIVEERRDLSERDHEAAAEQRFNALNSFHRALGIIDDVLARNEKTEHSEAILKTVEQLKRIVSYQHAKFTLNYMIHTLKNAIAPAAQEGTPQEA